MKLFILIALMLGLIACGNGEKTGDANENKLLINNIDSSLITKDIHLVNHQNTKSDNGRVKQRWNITSEGSQDGLIFEITGNNQADADLVSWSCEKFDEAGNSIKQTAESSFCHSFFIDVLSKFVTNPELITVGLLNRAHDNNTNAVHEIGDFSIETDGHYYFIRRISRI